MAESHPPLKVFISSTYIDLIDYRRAAIEVVDRYTCVPLAMEHFMSQPKEPEEVCEKEIKECDIFVGIYAHRYGFIPKRNKKSITHKEYDLAKKLKKDCFCFIVKNNFPWNPEFCEHEKRDELKAFLTDVKNHNTLSFFATKNDFESRLSASLGKLLVERKQTISPGEEKADHPSLIPIAPTPYIAHPYPMPPNFTGREAEKAMLSNWFYNGKEPILVLEAIGGMGKSALTWRWMEEEILEKSTELDGVLWWSFYEAPFEVFIQHLYHYVTSKEVMVERGALASGDAAVLYSVLFNNRFLLVLDGFERALRGYAGMRAMYIPEKGIEGGGARKKEEWDRRQREPVNPEAARFLKYIASAKARTLMTTRLFPAPLEDAAGVLHAKLSGLSRTDAVRFFRSEGIRGSRAEMERAGEIYDFHPLMLKLLTTAIKKKRKQDIQDAFRLNLIDQKEPQKILSQSFGLLSKQEQKTAITTAVFRSAFGFDSVKSLFPDIDEDGLWTFLWELVQLGFLFYDEKEGLFDFHPILRSFLYDRLTAKEDAHQRAVEYFKAIPGAKKIISLEDLAPVIELYHHMVGAGKFDEARNLYRDRLHEPLYYQLAQYNLAIELLRELFPDGEDQPPRLKKAGDRAWTLNELANSYGNSGQPWKAVSLFLNVARISEDDNDKEGVAVTLGNAACMAQIQIGRLSAAAVHLRTSIALCRAISNEPIEANGHQELALVLVYRGNSAFAKAHALRPDDGSSAPEELNTSTAYWKNEELFQALSVVFSYRSLFALLQSRMAVVMLGKEKFAENMARDIVEQAFTALEFSEKDAQTDYPMPKDFIRTYLMLGEGLVHCVLSEIALGKEYELRMYDEHFQKVSEFVIVKDGNILEAAERCLNEALRRCRSVNLVEFEPDILLASARLEWVKAMRGDAITESIPGMELLIKEAHEIAERAGYRLKLADIHLFCAEVLLGLKEKGLDAGKTLLGLAAGAHLKKVKEYAKDQSTIEDVYKSKDPHFYDGIKEYEMLARDGGMTEEERILNGYWIAHRIAEELEKRV